MEGGFSLGGRRVWTLSLVWTVWAYGCTGAVQTSTENVSGPGGNNENPPVEEGPPDNEGPPVQNECASIETILGSEGNRCTVCHDMSPGVEGGNLDLLSPGFGERLVGQPSGKAACNGQILIDRDSPENSLFLTLVDPKRYAAWGEDACMSIMPLGGAGMSEHDVECVEAWVEDLATNTPPPPPPPPPPPFEASSPSTALAKAKYTLHGGAMTEAELNTVTNENGTLDTAGLQSVIAGWVDTPQFQTKVRGFMGLALQQQTLHAGGNVGYREQIGNLQNGDGNVSRDRMVRNLDEGFERTAWSIVQSRQDFRQVVTTRTWEVTTAYLAALAFADREDRGRDEELRDIRSFRDSDYTDWRTVTIVQAGNGTPALEYQNSANFMQRLRDIEDGGTIALRAPRVGFFTAPSFFANWPTNVDNQHRITTNQTLVTALGMSFEAGDLTDHAGLDGLAEDHSGTDTACYQCHRLLDPMRLNFQNFFTTQGRGKDSMDDELQATFSFHGPSQETASMDEFAVALVDHPRFATAWVQKVCMWANSQRCDETDPNFTQLVQRFSNGYDLLDVVAAFFSTPLATGAESTKTFADETPFVSIARSNHFCAGLDARLEQARDARCEAERAANPGSNPRVCNSRNRVGCNITGTVETMADIISEDAYSRGGLGFVQESVSGPFNARAITEICTELADREVGAGDQTFGINVNQSLPEIVRYIMGIPPNHPRYESALAGLRRMYDVGRAEAACEDVVADNREEITCGFNLNTTRALYMAWIAACSSPELAGLGL